MKKSRSSILRYPDGPCTPGGFRMTTSLALVAILLCSFLLSASSLFLAPTTPTSFLSADAAHEDLGAGGVSSNSGDGTSGSTEPFLYKGQDTPVPTLVEHLVVDSSVTFIEEKAFVGLKNLKTVELPASLESIGKRAFYGCTR